MDRRDALKKLGGGAAIAVGASAVISSPAFAYDQPTAGTAATLAFVSVSGNAVTFSISPGTATCPGSANGTPVGDGSGLTNATPILYSTALATVTAVPVLGLPTEFRLGTTIGAPLLPPVGSGTPQTATGTSFTLSKWGTIFNTAQNFVNNDSFRAAITITFQCTYSDNTSRTRAVTTTRTMTRTGGSWNPSGPI